MKACLAALLLFIPELLCASSWSKAAEEELTSWKGTSSDALASIYRSAFLGDLPHYIKVSGEDSGKKPKEQHVYISDDIVSVRNVTGRWNVFANGKQTYAWKEGESVGIVTRYNPKELINYLLGVLSPCQLMSGIYTQQLETPTNFKILDKTETMEYTPVGPEFAFFTVIFQKSPPWLRGLKAANPETGDHYEFSVTFPKHIPEIPAVFSAPPPNIDFHEGVIPWQRELIPYL
jgi:hypothetical protein